jgi:hypothetical protein
VISEESTLKLHTGADGVVWYADGTCFPVSAQTNHAGICESRLFDRPRSVRVLGTEANAELLLELYRRRGDRVDRLELASPTLCENGKELQDPTIALFRMRQCLLPSAVGGWHVATDGDYISYALLCRLKQHDGWLDDEGRRLLELHPAWQDLSFLRGLDMQFVARVIARIRDPRWYVSALLPERMNRLRRFMGLDPHTQQRVSNGKQLVVHEIERRNFDMLAAWQKLEPPGIAEMQIPGNFLWRVWHSAGRGYKGDLRGSQMFLAYLYYIWLQGLNRQQGDVFDPSRIFKNADEIEAYKEHRRQRSGVV